MYNLSYGTASIIALNKKLKEQLLFLSAETGKIPEKYEMDS